MTDGKLHIARPRPSALGFKLALAALVAITIGGSERSLPTLFVLLEAFCAALAVPSLGLAIQQRRPRRPGAYGYWHEVAALAIVGVASHVALLAVH